MPAVCGFILTIGGLKTSSARPLRSLAERRSGVPPTSVRHRWRSAELPLERKCPPLQKLPLSRSCHSAQLRR